MVPDPISVDHLNCLKPDAFVDLELLGVSPLDDVLPPVPLAPKIIHGKFLDFEVPIFEVDDVIQVNFFTVVRRGKHNSQNHPGYERSN
jgi:hypothetical protein